MPLNTDVSIHRDCHVDNHDRGLLADLEFPIRKYPYEVRERLNNILEMELQRHQNAPAEDISEWVLFTGVDKSTLVRDFLEPSTPWTDAGWSSFDASQGLLLASTPNSRSHEAAAAAFGNLFLDAVEPTGLKYALEDLRSAMFEGEDKGKQPDNAWGPRRPPPGHDRYWPTVVTEIAYSETPSKLNSDVRFWLEGTGRNAQAVVTLIIDQKALRITVEKWQPQNSRAHRAQRITISKMNEQTTVEGGSLVIGFQELFLRPSDAPKETDFELGDQRLTLLATIIWEQQEQERELKELKKKKSGSRN